VLVAVNIIILFHVMKLLCNIVKN